MGVDMEPVTSGPIVNESLETSVEGVFACGNVLHVHDLVDFVSEEAAVAGRNAAVYIKAGGTLGEKSKEIPINAVDGVRYTVPKMLHINRMAEDQVIRFRVGAVYRNCYISAYLNGERIIHRKRQIMAPGEMEEIRLKKEQLDGFDGLEYITVKIEEG